MAFNHGAMIPGRRPVPVNRKTKKRQPKVKAPVVDFADDQVSYPELDPEVVVITEEEPKLLEENKERVMIDEDNFIPDPVEPEDVITEKELEAEIVPPKPKKKRRGRKRTITTEAS